MRISNKDIQLLSRVEQLLDAKINDKSHKHFRRVKEDLDAIILLYSCTEIPDVLVSDPKHINFCSKALSLRGKTCGILGGLSKTPAEKKRLYEMLIADCDIALNYDDGCIRAYGNRGRAYSEIALYSETVKEAIDLRKKAIEDFSKVVALDKTDVNALSCRGAAYHILADFIEPEENPSKKTDCYEKAITDFSSAIHLKDTDFELWSLRGHVHADYADFLASFELKQENYRDAIDDYSMSISLAKEQGNDSSLAYVFSERGTVRANFAQLVTDKEEGLILLKGAISDCEEGIKFGGVASNAYGTRGYVYKMCAKLVTNPRERIAYYKDAISDFTLAISLNADFELAYFNRGDTYGELVYYEKDLDRSLLLCKNAIADYTVAISLSKRENLKSFIHRRKRTTNGYSLSEEYINRGVTYAVMTELSQNNEYYINALSDWMNALWHSVLWEDPHQKGIRNLLKVKEVSFEVLPIEYSTWELLESRQKITTLQSFISDTHHYFHNNDTFFQKYSEVLSGSGIELISLYVWDRLIHGTLNDDLARVGVLLMLLDDDVAAAYIFAQHIQDKSFLDWFFLGVIGCRVAEPRERILEFFTIASATAQKIVSERKIDFLGFIKSPLSVIKRLVKGDDYVYVWAKILSRVDMLNSQNYRAQAPLFVDNEDPLEVYPGYFSWTELGHNDLCVWKQLADVDLNNIPQRIRRMEDLSDSRVQSCLLGIFAEKRQEPRLEVVTRLIENRIIIEKNVKATIRYAIIAPELIIFSQRTNEAVDIFYRERIIKGDDVSLDIREYFYKIDNLSIQKEHVSLYLFDEYLKDVDNQIKRDIFIARVFKLYSDKLLNEEEIFFLTIWTVICYAANRPIVHESIDPIIGRFSESLFSGGVASIVFPGSFLPGAVTEFIVSELIRKQSEKRKRYGRLSYKAVANAIRTDFGISMNDLSVKEDGREE
jgi:tetratricopeptide (TPR) repeat protein